MNRTDLARKDQGSMFKKREQEREGRVDRMEVLGGLNDFPWWAGRLGVGKGLRKSDEDRGLGGTYQGYFARAQYSCQVVESALSSLGLMQSDPCALYLPCLLYVRRYNGTSTYMR